MGTVDDRGKPSRGARLGPNTCVNGQLLVPARGDPASGLHHEWPRASRRNVLPVPDGAQTIRFSRRCAIPTGNPSCGRRLSRSPFC
jgi:hypothetical protein